MAEEIKVVDRDGKWYVNSGAFRMVDTTNNDRHVAFEPGIPTKVTPSAWIAGQSVLTEVPDPLGEEVKPKKEVK